MKYQIRSLRYLWLVAVLALAGCASLGLPQAQTVQERLTYAHSSVNSLVAASISSLDAHAISSDDAAYVRKVATDTRTLLNAAELAMSAGDSSTAEGRLGLAEGVLRQLRAYLAQKGVK